MFNFFMPKPYKESYLPEKDGHQIYVAEYGNPKGKPVLIIHGGPGYFSRPSKAKYFDNKKHRIIMFDQRGCGKSIAKNAYKNNTIKDTIKDIDRIFEHLKIKQKVILSGTSFGTTVALCYAEENPKKTKALILNSIFLARKEDIKYAIEDTKLFYPEFYEEVHSNSKNLSDLFEMAKSKDEEAQKKAIKYYFNYEWLLGTLSPKFHEPNLRFLSGTQIALHYVTNNLFLKDNQILSNIDSIEKIPTLIVHNRLDLTCPISGAYQLYKSLKKAKFVAVPELGHGGKLMSKTLRKETKKFLAQL